MHVSGVPWKLAKLVQRWRAADGTAGSRTNHVITPAEQFWWWLVRRHKTGGYWGVLYKGEWVAMMGLQHITDFSAEISLIVNPDLRGRHIGQYCLDELLRIGHEELGLYRVWGEVYECNRYIGWWRKEIARRKADSMVLPRRKCFEGMWYDSLVFWFDFTGKGTE